MIVCEHVWFLSLGRVEQVYIYKPRNLRPYKLNLDYRNYKIIKFVCFAGGKCVWIFRTTYSVSPEKGKAVPQHTYGCGCAGGGGIYSSYSFMTSVLDGGEWSALCPGHVLPLRKGLLVPTGQEAGLAPEPVWTKRLQE
jgi:hypothetical protein